MAEYMLTYKLSAYEGPLDLLCRLIQLNKIDIFDIPISELTEQYITFLEEADGRDMDNMSEFLLMAATLLEIKSKTLLPKADGEVCEDPRNELVDSILEYRKAKLAAELLNALEEENEGLFVKPPQSDLIKSLRPAETIDDVLEGVTLASLYSLFEDVMNRRERKIDKIRSAFNSVRKDKFTVEKKAAHIKRLLKITGSIHFGALLADCLNKAEIVVTFLAVLELVKTREIEARQESLFGDIEIRMCA